MRATTDFGQGAGWAIEWAFEDVEMRGLWTRSDLPFRDDCPQEEMYRKACCPMMLQRVEDPASNASDTSLDCLKGPTGGRQHI